MAVHRELGHGFLESVYQEALTHELEIQRIPFESEVEFRVTYRRRYLKGVFRVDLVCSGEVIVELKAVKRLSGVEEAQVINYLKASGLRKGLLLNFGTTSLEYRRFLFDKIPIPQSVKSV